MIKFSSYYGSRNLGDSIAHHGILGQKWGVKNGPPYPLKGGSYTKSEERKIREKRHRHRNSIYNKKHFDEVLDTKTTLRTLSYNKDRTKDTDMFYATHDFYDKHQYNALFNRAIKQPLYNGDGEIVGSKPCFKFSIDNSIKTDMKVASEDSATKKFLDLYENDRDFYNFVTDPKRMQSYFVEDKYKFRGYREARKSLEKARQTEQMPSQRDVSTIYRMFNYVLPYDGGGNDARGAKDVKTNRDKFFKSLKKDGYGAVLDTNDAIYGAFKARSPVIVFDTENILPKSVYQTKMSDVKKSTAIFAYRKATHK